MRFFVLDQSFETLDYFESFRNASWIIRYQSPGEFELEMPATQALVDLFTHDRYVMLDGEEHLMIIESIKIGLDWQNGDTLTVSGRSLESLLDRRIIWNKVDFSNTNLQTAIQTILNANVINPSDTARKIPGFVFTPSNDSRITGLTLTASYHGENILEVIQMLCEQYDLGFKVLPVPGGGYSMTLFAGTDRSYAQETNPWIVFSEGYENIGDTSSTRNKSILKNSCLIYNERTYRSVETNTVVDEEGHETTTTETHDEVIITQESVDGKDGAQSGLARREMYIESSKSNYKADGTEMTTDEYKAALRAEASEELGEHNIDTAFSGKAEVSRQHVVNEDFFLGDIVQISTRFGIEERVRVYEIAWAQSPTENAVVPSFVNVPG